MSSQDIRNYSAARNEIVDVKLNLSGYVTQKEFKNLTGNVNTSCFALKTNVAEIKSRVDDIDVNKINIIDELQSKYFFEESYLLFEPKYKYFKVHEFDKNYLSSWKSIGLSDQEITSENDSYAPKIFYYYKKIYLNFTSSDTLKENKLTYTHGLIVNLYIVHFCSYCSLPSIIYSTKDDILNDCLFGAVSLIKDGTIKIDKVKIQGYGVSFGSKTYTHKDGQNARNLIIFGGDLNDKNKKYSSLVLGKGSIELNNTTIQAEDELKTNCMVPNERFVLSVHYNSDTIY